MLHTFCGLLLCCVVWQENSVAGANPEYLKSMQQGWTEYHSGLYRAAEGSFLTALRALEQRAHPSRFVKCIASVRNALVLRGADAMP